MKRIILSAVLIFFTLFLFAGCKRLEKTELRFVEYQKITPKKPDAKKEFFGFIQAGGEAQLGFEVSGIIKKIYFTDGDSVKRGQVIATVDNEINELEEMENEALLKDAYVQFENAKSYYERIDKLHAVGGISDNDWDKAKTNMESRKHQIDVSKERLQASKKRAGYGKLIAPLDGIILRKTAEEGQYISPGQTVVWFQDNRDTEAKIFVAERYINEIQTGKEVEITADILKEPKKAKIKSITKTSIDEGSYRVTVIFDKQYPELKDGMAIRAYINLEPREEDGEIIQIPLNALLEDEKSSYVWLLEDIKDNIAKIKRQNVEADEIRNDLATVRGLGRGDLIVIKGAGEIMEGQRVKIRPLEQ